jgi:hypothetical protein
MSERINLAVAASRGAVICLLDSTVEVITPNWMDEMIALALQPGVGAVGARLWSTGEHLRNSGLILGIGGLVGHSHSGLPRGHPGHCGRAALTQAVSAVTGECLMVRKDLYQRAGGLNVTDLAVAFSDVDFCLKLCELGFRNVWTPYAEFYHHGSAPEETTVTPDAACFRGDRDYLLRRWATSLGHDPVYNPNLTLEREDFSPAFPPRALKPWRKDVKQKLSD